MFALNKTYNRTSYLVNISTPFEALPFTTSEIIYSLNAQEYFRSSERLRYLPDVIIRDI